MFFNAPQREREREAHICVKEVLVEGPNSRERPLGRWKDRVKEYMCERGASRRSKQ